MALKDPQFCVVGTPDTAYADGDYAPVRASTTGELGVSAVHGEFYEATSRGNVYYAATAAGGVAHGTSVSTTAAFYLHNPLGSDVYLSILAASIGYLSGTLGAGTMFLTSHIGKTVANPTGTAIVPRKTRLGNNSQGAALAFTTATVVTQYLIRPVWSFSTMGANEIPPFPCKDQINGEIVVAPGFGVGLHSIATAGTTPLVRLGMTWEEVPIDTATLLSATPT